MTAAEPNPVVVVLPLLPYVACLIAGASAKRWNQCWSYAGIGLALLMLIKLVFFIIVLRSRAVDNLPHFIGYQIPIIMLGFGFAALGFGCRRLIERLTRQKLPPPPPLPPEQAA